MAFSFRKLGKRFFIISNLIVCGLFLVSCLQPWLNPNLFWFIGFFSIMFPYLLLLVLAFLIFWLLAKPRYCLISLISLLLSWNQISALFNFNVDPFKKEKVRHSIRAISWNIQGFKAASGDKNARKEKLAAIFNYINSYNPDLVCFQEFGQFDTPDKGSDHVEMMSKIGLTHHVLSKDYSRVTFGYTNGVAIFSKYPIVSTRRVPFSSSPESVLSADIAVDGDTIRLFTSHLQSFKFNGKDYQDLEKIKKNDHEIVPASRNIVQKMRKAFRNRGQQADMIRPILDSSNYPEIFALDMNDVPASYAYWKLRGNRADAFLEQGFGLGRTFLTLAPTLRINYIFADPAFEIIQMEVGQAKYSDHLPVIADLKLRKYGAEKP